MANKRPAEQSIDEKTLEYQAAAPEAPPASAPEPRTILQVKRVGEEAQPKKETTAEAEKAETAKEESKPLFASLFQNNKNGVGLFSNVGIFSAAKQGLLQTNKEASNIDLKASNLFTGNGFNPQPTKATSLFSNNPSSLFSNNSSSLFSNTPIGSSLVSNTQGSSIFNFGQGTIPPVRNGAEDEPDEGDSAELEHAQEMQIDRSKSKGHFDYKDEVKVLFSGLARKYKRNNGDLVEGVEIVLQQDEKNKLVYLVVRLAATKNRIFTGYILEGKSSVRILNNKKENLEVGAFTIPKGKPAQLEKLKLQLDTPESGNQLNLKLEDAIAGKLQTAEGENPDEKKVDEAEKKESEEVAKEAQASEQKEAAKE